MPFISKPVVASHSPKNLTTHFLSFGRMHIFPRILPRYSMSCLSAIKAFIRDLDVAQITVECFYISRIAANLSFLFLTGQLLSCRNACNVVEI